MASEYEPIETAPRAARPLRTLLIVALAAFLVGLIAMGIVIRKWGGGMGYFGRESAVADERTALGPGDHNYHGHDLPARRARRQPRRARRQW